MRLLYFAQVDTGKISSILNTRKKITEECLTLGKKVALRSRGFK